MTLVVDHDVVRRHMMLDALTADEIRLLDGEIIPNAQASLGAFLRRDLEPAQHDETFPAEWGVTMLRLPVTPVATVEEVSVAGNVIDALSYRITPSRNAIEFYGIAPILGLIPPYEIPIIPTLWSRTHGWLAIVSTTS